jgi:predicted RNase H-like HicB family nuclease
MPRAVFIPKSKRANWRVVLEQDEETGEWAAWVAELPGGVSAGATKHEARQSMREAVRLRLQSDAPCTGVAQRS